MDELKKEIKEVIISTLQLEDIKPENILLGENNNLGFYCDALYDVLNLINDKCERICAKEIGIDFSFDLQIYVNKEKKGMLFSQILNLKSMNELVAEISIILESTEKII